MPEIASFTLSEQVLVGLFYIQRYRFLTIDQFARVTGFKKPNAAEQLRVLEKRGMLGYFGNTGKVGYGKTPKVYYLTHKGWEILLDLLQKSGMIQFEVVKAGDQVES